MQCNGGGNLFWHINCTYQIWKLNLLTRIFQNLYTSLFTILLLFCSWTAYCRAIFSFVQSIHREYIHTSSIYSERAKHSCPLLLPRLFIISPNWTLHQAIVANFSDSVKSLVASYIMKSVVLFSAVNKRLISSTWKRTTLLRYLYRYLLYQSLSYSNSKRKTVNIK